jgi:hypothetical protein
LRDPAYGRTWWAGLAVGSAVMAWGLVGLARQAASTTPPAWAAWLLVTLLVNDLLVLPAAFAVARLTSLTPAPWRRALRAALAVSAVLVLVTLPAFLGDGRSTQPGNRSVLPGDYPRSLALLVALVWAVAGAWVALALRRARLRRPSARPCR